MGESSWVVELTQDLDKSIGASRGSHVISNWQKRSIYKLPETVTELNPNAYKPRVVSFGPYHHGAPHLKPMEDHKCRALHNFIDRAHGKTSRDLIGAVSEVVKELKDCYDSLDPVWDSDERFVKLMILDGCFMLQVLRMCWESDYTLGYEYDDDDDDFIFSNHVKLYTVPSIRRDMLILENQLPMLLLDILVAFEGSKGKDKNVINLIFKFFSQNEVKLPDKCLHVLDAYRKTLIHKGPSRKTRIRRDDMFTFTSRRSKETIRWSATELVEAGIMIKASDSLSLRDISFTDGVLRLPMVTVDDTTESMFLNLLAFERFHVSAGNAVGSYILTMNSMIDNEKDVALLQSQGIIWSVVGCDKDVATLFGSLSRDEPLSPGDFNLMLVHGNVIHDYCRKLWTARRANLVRNFFSSAWSIFSLIAAILLLALTIIQTIFTVFPRKNN